MTNGCRVLEGYVPDVDATVVSRILDAGGHIVGKAVCEALCLSTVSFTSSTGPVLNPHDRSRITGGSSTGSAALVRYYMILYYIILSSSSSSSSSYHYYYSTVTFEQLTNRHVLSCRRAL